MSRRVELVLRFRNSLGCGIFRGDSAIHLLPSLVESFNCGKAFGNESAGTVELLVREFDLRLLYREIRPRLFERPFRLAHQRLRFLQRCLEVAGIHHRDHLARPHDVAFVDEELRDAAGELCVDVNRVGFEPTIAIRDAGRQLHLMVPPP